MAKQLKSYRLDDVVLRLIDKMSKTHNWTHTRVIEHAIVYYHSHLQKDYYESSTK